MTSEGNFELSKEWPALQHVKDIKKGPCVIPIMKEMEDIT
jgi:hypothetical protein